MPDPPNQTWSKIDPTAFEELTLLSFIAGVTERVKLGTYVLLAPLRNPLVLLKQVTTLDVLSNGRVILGLGLGWMKEEFEASGVPLAERGRRTDDMIRFLRKAWTASQPLSYQSKFIAVGPSFLEPLSIQRPIPIWIGGMSAGGLKRAARIGDGWLPNAAVSPEVVKASIETIMSEAKRRGRDPSGITISCRLTLKGMESEAPQVVSEVESLTKLGVHLFIVDFQGPGDDAEKIEMFSRSLMRSF